eukprot:Gb_27812 [translate_table: standard]
MDAYKEWVRANRHFISSIESFAHTMTWFLPERFSSSEIAPEAVTALVGLITAVNQHIIENSPRPVRHVGSVPSGLTQHSLRIQETGFPWSLCISGVKEVEVLIEVAAEHYLGKDKKWSFVAATEAVKAFLRLILLHENGYKMLIDGGVTANVEDASGPPEIQSMHSSGQPGGRTRAENFGECHVYNPENMEYRALHALHKFGEHIRMASSHTEEDYAERTLQQPLSLNRSTLASIWREKGFTGGCFILGEVLVILRPFFYALLIKKYGIGSWKPWLLSLAMDLAGMSIISRVTLPDLIRNGRTYSLSRLEKQEVQRRQLLWALYLMRDPFFSKYTRHRLEYSEQLLKPVPVIGTLTAKAVELIIGVQTRYSYTSAS